MYCVTRLLVGRLHISFISANLSWHKAFISFSSSNLPWKCCKTKAVTNAQSSCATKSFRDELTQDQNPTADHNVNGSALWVFCTGKGWSPVSGGTVRFQTLRCSLLYYPYCTWHSIENLSLSECSKRNVCTAQNPRNDIQKTREIRSNYHNQFIVKWCNEMQQETGKQTELRFRRKEKIIKIK